jgi:hypothetical protein
MDTAILLVTVAVKIAQNWAPVLALTPAVAWWAVWGE